MVLKIFILGHMSNRPRISSPISYVENMGTPQINSHKEKNPNYTKGKNCRQLLKNTNMIDKKE